MSDTLERVLTSMDDVKAPQRQFMLVIFTAFMSFVGRATLRNLCRYTNKMSERTMTRWFRRNFKYTELNAALLKQAWPDKRPLIAAIDASFIQKSGKKTDGLAKFWNGSRACAERGLEISTLAIVDTLEKTAYGLDTRQTIECEEDSRVVQYIQQIKDNATLLKSIHIKYLAADGYYSKFSFVNAVVECGLHMIGKLRRDANLWWPYMGLYAGKGRKKSTILRLHSTALWTNGLIAAPVMMETKFIPHRCIPNQ